MKFQLFLLCLLSSIFLITGCEDDDDGSTASPIQIRLLNETGEDLTDADLRFNLGDEMGDYLEYGALASGENSDYMGYEAAGSCDSDLLFCLADFDDCQNLVAQCECICSLEPGNYTGTIGLIATPAGNFYTLDFNLDE